ncbi:anti-sigma factor [Dyadobacter psychrotolerans]|uniref:Anti-sigma factor n=1 Tax=Dyadobacter psychrotolerans TaxID=2541721 RepID=A0A4R5DJU9_9BACT|nr:anti-sigma factor [Dyadobacter psychrotolerans]TDE11105.1 anti-sigma factor [Dyadobacter psychrotolerans]
MNIQAYIESGILEEYVLGTVSPQEKQEVECMSHIYPEIKEELLRTESALEEYALKHQTAPPASLKESLFSRMNFDSPDAQKPDEEFAIEESNVAKNISNDIRNGDFVEIPAPLESADAKVISDAFVREEVKEVTPFWAKLAIAASILLTLFAGWSAMQVADMRKTNEAMSAEMQNMKKDAIYAEQVAAMYRDPQFKLVKLAGLPKSPESNVSAFWNKQTNEVMLDIQNLPPAPAGKQYQLWSIVDGAPAPVDLGMLDEQFEKKLLKMKNTKNGSVAFAITLEKKGGNPTPTMEEMYVMGKVV